MRTKKYMPMLFLFAILFSLLAMPIHADAASKSKFTNLKISEANFPDKNLRAVIKKADKNNNGFLSWDEFHKEFYDSVEGRNFYGIGFDKEIKNTKGLELLPFDHIVLSKYNGGDITEKNMTNKLDRLFIDTVKTKGNCKITLPGLNELTLGIADEDWKDTEINGLRISEAAHQQSKAVFDLSGCKNLQSLDAGKVTVTGLNQCPNLRRIDMLAVTNKGKLDLSKLTKLEYLRIDTQERIIIDGEGVNEHVDFPIEITEIDISGAKKLINVGVFYDYVGKKLKFVMNKTYKKYFENGLIVEDEGGYDGYYYVGVSYSAERKEGTYENSTMIFK